MVVSKPIRRLAAAALFMIGFAVLARAQDKPDNLLMRLFQPPASASVPTPGAGGGTGDWSGQAGASGDPRMTADAIRAIDVRALDERERCLLPLLCPRLRELRIEGPLREAAEQGLAAYAQAFLTAVGTNPMFTKALPFVLYETLGPTLPDGLAGAAALWGLAQKAAMTFIP